MPKGKHKKLGWKVAHTANSPIEILAENILLDLIKKQAYDIVVDTNVPRELKDVGKIIAALRTAEVMLVWKEDEEE